MLTESSLKPEDAVYRKTVLAGDYWIHEIKKGQTFRIVDVEGNQAADTIFYDALDPENRYSASDTVRRQGALYLTTGSELVSNFRRRAAPKSPPTPAAVTILSVVPARARATRCATPQRRNTCTPAAIVSFGAAGLASGAQYARPALQYQLLHERSRDARRKAHLRGWYFRPGLYVEMVAERDVMCLISNCPQLNNPCNAYNPTPIETIIWD